jgi:hypothetical protein
MLNKVLLKHSLKKLMKTPLKTALIKLFQWFSGKIDFSSVHLLTKWVIRFDITLDSIIFFCNYISTISTFNPKFNMVVVAVSWIFFKKCIRVPPFKNFCTNLRQEWFGNHITGGQHFLYTISIRVPKFNSTSTPWRWSCEKLRKWSGVGGEIQSSVEVEWSWRYEWFNNGVRVELKKMFMEVELRRIIETWILW